MGQKRGNESKPQALQTKKRKKGAKAGLTSSDGAWDGAVDVDQLNWKDVALPDSMADVGGFFGLEEIDDVEIIRPNGGGEVQFKVRAYISPTVQRLRLLTRNSWNRQRQANLKSQS